MPKTLYEKIYDQHCVLNEAGALPILYIDLHLCHEVTSPQAFAGLRKKKLKIRRLDRSYLTIDHVIPSLNPEKYQENTDDKCQIMIEAARKNAQDFKVKTFDIKSGQQGIVHVIFPELGITQPGMTIVCGDSHTATHGAFGALAFGIGTSEVEEVFATQCLLQEKLKNMKIEVSGQLTVGVTAKDVIMKIIQKIGMDGGTGFALEYTGQVIKNMSMEERMTLCNMSIEGGARVGIIAPDRTTFQFLKNRPYVPQGKDWTRQLRQWRLLKSDHGAKYQKTLKINGQRLKPMLTYGTHPHLSMGIDEQIPHAQDFKNPRDQKLFKRALQYMNFREGEKLIGKKIDYVFIGSCTNGRLTDLIAAAKILKGQKINQKVKMIVVPGSQQIKKTAEKQGLAQIFIKAGAEWRFPSCSYCLGMNGDEIPSGNYCLSTSNRNFEGRQGRGARTILVSPLTAAAGAIAGKIVDVRKFIKS